MDWRLLGEERDTVPRAGRRVSLGVRRGGQAERKRGHNRNVGQESTTSFPAAAIFCTHPSIPLHSSSLAV